MYTIEDYIKYYGNRDFNDVKWNIQDTLICSILSYLIFNSYNKEIYLYQFFDSLKNYEEKIMKDYSARNAYNVLKKMINAKRYLEMKIKNIEYLYNDKTMFGAFTVKLDNKTIVAFKGSDSSAIAWKENFRDGYLFPTYTQNKAINYLNKVKGEKIIVCGHSKGGNLALVSAMECNNKVFKNILEIDNFDGPGLRWEEFSSNKYDKILPILRNIIPTGSYIGTMLYNQKYELIATNTKGILVHSPFNWLVFGDTFVQGKNSLFSNKIKNITTEELDKLDNKKYGETLEKIFDRLPNDLNGNNKITLKEIKNIINNFNDIDKDTKDYLLKIINTLIMGIFH